MKVAVVTGATRGIGLSIAQRLAAEGYRVVTTARHAPAAADPDFIACDVTDAASVRVLFELIRTRFGRVDVLINNAGTAGANALDGDDGLWHSIVASNLHGTYHCCKAALPLLTDNGGRDNPSPLSKELESWQELPRPAAGRRGPGPM